MRERGLKLLMHLRKRKNPILVVPRAGTWIETYHHLIRKCLTFVVPRAGTWIETCIIKFFCRSFLSFPVRERGLKLIYFSFHGSGVLRRSPCGNVD